MDESQLFKLKDLKDFFTTLTKLSNKTVLITGGTGYVGKCLLDCLLNANRILNLNLKLILLTRDSLNFQNEFHLAKNASEIDFHYVDFSENNNLNDIKKKISSIDYAIHAATSSIKEKDINIFESNPSLYFGSIVNGTKQILEILKLKPDIKCLYISSGAVYRGINQKTIFSEDDWSADLFIPMDTDVYTLGKRLSEKYFFDNLKNAEFENFCIARCFTFIGPYLPLGIRLAGSTFFTNISRKEPLIINGDGSDIRSFMHSYDLAIWLIKVLIEGRPGEAYNVGSDEAISIKDFAEKISSIVNEKFQNLPKGVEYSSRYPVIIKNEVTSLTANKVYLPDTSKAKKELSLDLKFNLDEAISNTLRYYGLQPNGLD